jgi:glycosyltransferase involved in cell wall biosynthesis
VNRPGLLVVNTSRSWGGNEHWALRVARDLAGRGHPVRFVYSHEVVGERVAEAGLDRTCLRLGGDLDPRGVLALREEMLKVRARAVLLTRWPEYLRGGLAARAAGRPRVVLRLGLRIVPRDDLKRRLIFRLADRVIVNAVEIREALRERPWIPDRKIAVVVNGLDLDRWQPRWQAAPQARGLALRASLGLAGDTPLAVTVGNLTAQKDHATLIDACAALRRELPNLRVLIAGEGGLRGDLEERIAAAGLQDTVTLLGFRADVDALLAAANVFVLSSANEGMARVLIEAAASGLPIVTTDVSGARYCVEHGVTGLVVPPGDAAALAAGLGDLLQDGPRRRAMGREGRHLAETRFAVGRMVDETARVLFG